MPTQIKLIQIANNLQEDLFQHRIHGDYALKKLFEALDQTETSKLTLNQIMQSHHARWNSAHFNDDIDDDIDFIYHWSALNPQDNQKQAILQHSLDQCQGDVVILEANIYRYRDITDLEAASIIEDVKPQLRKD